MSTTRITHPPVVGELKAIFAALPDKELIARLRGPRRRGRPGYDPEILWRTYICYYYLGLESVSALIRILYDNPYIAAACGIHSPAEMPNQSTFSRFGSRLARPLIRTLVRNVTRALTRALYERFPDFGKSVAIDSTDIRAWSNGGKKGKDGKVTDKDAGWVVKSNTDGRKKFVWGYKVHILADTHYELPLVVDTTAGNVHDIRKATPLLQQARFTYRPFKPDYVICDAGYSSDKLRRTIKKQYHTEPIIDPNPTHKRAVQAAKKTADWRTIYRRRGGIERLNGRLKAFRKLNHVRVRGRFKVRIHVLLSIITLQARALAFPAQMRDCVRAIA